MSVNETAEAAYAVYNLLRFTYPDATIIGLPENIISEITTISKDDPLNEIYRENYYNLRKINDSDFEDDELLNM